METLKQYFARPETPSEHSPVGFLMATILEKYPDTTFEAARARANELLDKAAGKKVYRFPRVLSEAELEAGKARLRAAFPKSQKRDLGPTSTTNDLT
jgi:hypothetical protein